MSCQHWYSTSSKLLEKPTTIVVKYSRTVRIQHTLLKIKVQAETFIHVINGWQQWLCWRLCGSQRKDLWLVLLPLVHQSLLRLCHKLELLPDLYIKNITVVHVLWNNTLISGCHYHKLFTASFHVDLCDRRRKHFCHYRLRAEGDSWGLLCKLPRRVLSEPSRQAI